MRKSVAQPVNGARPDHGPEPTVLLLCPLHDRARAAFLQDQRVVVAKGLDDPDLDRSAESLRTLVVRSNVQVDRGLLDRLPQLERVLRAGSGIDNIDIELLRSRHITLHRYADVSAGAVAELGVAALVLLARQIPLADWLNRRGRFAKDELWGEPVADLEVAVWGAGPVGRATYEALRPLCKAISFAGHTTRVPGLPYRAPTELLAQADAHLLCVPLRATTRRFFDAATLAAVRERRPYIVNVGRYELLDIQAAIAALRRGELRGLFVEPIDRHHLREVTPILADGEPVNLLTSQHLGGQRVDVHERIRDWILGIIGHDPSTP